MKRKILFRKNTKLGKGVNQYEETAITKKGRISDKYTVTEKDAKGNLHIISEQFVSSPNKTIKKESKPKKSTTSTKKKASAKKKTPAKKTTAKRK